MEFSADAVGLKVGLEIHQQLDTGRKLFCSCPYVESDMHPIKFQRQLRASRGELGRYDQAALFERARARTITYHANAESSCMVEQDEEPPHALDGNAKRAVLVIAAALKSRVFGEVYPMRKTVVDGSNTSGFQRTMLVSQGGSYDAGVRQVRIQSVCLEEDAAKIIDDRAYSLERLGVPLVEVATEPLDIGPGDIRDVALALGRILRSTRLVRRGLGSIRQDVNVSIKDGRTVVEVKGVQQLDQLEKVAQYEARRQYGMLRISQDLKTRGLGKPRILDATGLASSWDSKIVQNALKQNHTITLMAFESMAGIFGKEHVAGVRLGRDVAEIAKSFGLGGVFHSDELPAYGISGDDVSQLCKEYEMSQNDAFLLLAAPREMSDMVAGRIFERIVDIRDSGVPRDTRAATPAGETRFLRPRPGAARMYPETDVMPVRVSREELEYAEKHVPKPWDESVRDIADKFGISQQLAEQLYDSRYLELFENIAGSGTVGSAFVASTLCSSITRLERDGLDPGLLADDMIVRAFELLGQGRIAKESIEIIFESIMSGRSSTVDEAVKAESLEAVNESDLADIIEKAVESNLGIITKQKERASGLLMGIIMKELRGKAPGDTVSRLLQASIKKRLG